MAEIALVMGAVVLVVVEEIRMIMERRAWYGERRDLLDRIMAKDFSQYSTSRVEDAQAGARVEVVKVEDLEARINDRDREVGIPV